MLALRIRLSMDPLKTEERTDIVISFRVQTSPCCGVDKYAAAGPDISEIIACTAGRSSHIYVSVLGDNYVRPFERPSGSSLLHSDFIAHAFHMLTACNV